jgi:hypothetical protein
MKRIAAASLVAGLAGPTTLANATTVSFTTFVSGSDLSAALSNQSTIAFNYTGTGFIGSVYFGPNNDQLYSTNLTGGNVEKFGQPIPGASGEVVIGVGLGQAGFAKGAIYAGSGGNGNQIFLVPSSGPPTLFGSTLNSSEAVRQIFFDPGSTFGGKMLVTTTLGNIYSFDSSGTPTFIASVGADAEGMDIASSALGPYAGQLLVASEGASAVFAVSNTGVVTPLVTGISLPETISTVPLDLGSGNPLEGFYVANFPTDIQKAAADQFTGLLGDAILTQEFGSNSPLTALSWNGSSIVETPIGNLPGQSEDGIFVTAEREHLIGTPEPSTWAMLLLGFAGLGLVGYRKAKGQPAFAA